MEESNIDLGLVQIHKKAIADIALSAIHEIEGVRLIPQSPGRRILEFFGKKSYSGISVLIDKDNQVTVKLKVNVKYGMNISDVARQVQDSVRAAIEKTADIHLRDVHVNVHGLELESERGEL